MRAKAATRAAWQSSSRADFRCFCRHEGGWLGGSAPPRLGAPAAAQPVLAQSAKRTARLPKAPSALSDSAEGAASASTAVAVPRRSAALHAAECEGLSPAAHVAAPAPPPCADRGRRASSDSSNARRDSYSIMACCFFSQIFQDCQCLRAFCASSFGMLQEVFSSFDNSLQ